MKHITCLLIHSMQDRTGFGKKGRFFFFRFIFFLPVHFFLFLTCGWHCPVLFSAGYWMFNHMTLPTPARLANGYMALTNGTSRSRPYSHPISHSSGDIVVNMDSEPNIKKMETVVKLDAVRICVHAWRLESTSWVCLHMLVTIKGVEESRAQPNTG